MTTTLPDGDFTEARRRCTPRQAEAVAYAASGFTTEETAAALGVKTSTVVTWFRQLRAAWGCHSKPHIVAVAAAHNHITVTSNGVSW